ncbi:hypothetical protein M5689_002440 [Euphorbia peplus]|nr:hypothetical protein M5689_002440 [Euphorbia peplus]
MKFEDPTAVVGWSEFEQRLGISASSLPQLPGREFDKSVVIIKCFFEHDSTSECWFYCMDVNSSSTALNLKPFIRDSVDLGYHAYLILGSTLYMFGRAENGSVFGDSFSHYDMKTALSSSENPTLYLCKESLVQGWPMQARKNCPNAVVIADSRICVFSMVLAPRFF